MIEVWSERGPVCDGAEEQAGGEAAVGVGVLVRERGERELCGALERDFGGEGGVTAQHGEEPAGHLPDDRARLVLAQRVHDQGEAVGVGDGVDGGAQGVELRPGMHDDEDAAGGPDAAQDLRARFVRCEDQCGIQNVRD